MATILPVSELRNYNKVLDKVSLDEPVYLTMSGVMRYIIQDINVEKEHEEIKAMLTLFLNLRHGKMSGEKEGYINISDIRKHFGIN